jgi:hypothetical protein
VCSVLEMFPGAEITAVRQIGAATEAAPAPVVSDDVEYAPDENLEDDP